MQVLIESTRTRHFLKRKPTYALLDIVFKYLEVLQEGGLQSDKTIQRHVSKLLVGTHMTVAYRNRSTGRPTIVHNLEAISRKKFPRSQYQLMYTIAQVGQSKNVKFIFFLQICLNNLNSDLNSTGESKGICQVPSIKT